MFLLPQFHLDRFRGRCVTARRSANTRRWWDSSQHQQFRSTFPLFNYTVARSPWCSQRRWRPFVALDERPSRTLLELTPSIPFLRPPLPLPSSYYEDCVSLSLVFILRYVPHPVVELAKLTTRLPFRRSLNLSLEMTSRDGSIAFCVNTVWRRINNIHPLRISSVAIMSTTKCDAEWILVSS